MVKFTSKAQEQVKEFHEAFNHPVSEHPKPMELERAINRSIWTGEELIEFLQSSCKNQIEFDEAYDKFLRGLQQAYQKSLKGEFIENQLERLVAQADALTDASYFINGSFVELGVDAQPIFNIVQNANMSKLFIDENGKKYAKYRDDGKILKSPDFYTPEPLIKEEVQNQINNTLTK